MSLLGLSIKRVIVRIFYMSHIDSVKLYEHICQHLPSWKRIARQSGEHEADEIANEAWLFIIKEWNKEPFDINNPEHWDCIQSIMYNRFVGFAEKNLKYATHIDQTIKHNDNEMAHPLLNQLTAAEYNEPLYQLIEEEKQQENWIAQNKAINQYSFSKLVAFWVFFQSLDPMSMSEKAQLMKMSQSWLYCCINFAKVLKRDQPSLFDSIETAPLAVHLKSWRSFKITRGQFKAAPIASKWLQLKLFE